MPFVKQPQRNVISGFRLFFLFSFLVVASGVMTYSVSPADHFLIEEAAA